MYLPDLTNMNVCCAIYLQARNVRLNQAMQHIVDICNTRLNKFECLFYMQMIFKLETLDKIKLAVSEV